MSTQTIQFSEALYHYYQQVGFREPAILKKLREETSHLSGALMQISPEQGQLMSLLIDLLQAKKTLDIGTFTGYSALVVALAMPADGKVITCDIDSQSTDLAQSFWQEAKVSNKIELRLAPALETLQDLLSNGEAETVDFAFIDADKNNYANYYELSLKLLRPGGLIAIDNVLWGGKVADETVQDSATSSIRQLNELVLKDTRVTLSMLPIGDGLTLVRKR